MSDIDNLLDLKKKIDNAVREKDQMEGRIQQIKEDLKNKHKVKTLREAKHLLSKMEKELEQEETLFSEQVQELEELYEEENDK